MENNLICRLCLYNNEDILPIFGEQQQEAKLQEKLLQYINLEIKEDDPLPKLICLKCFQTVENFHAFYQEVTQNQTVFEYTTQPGIMVISDQDSHTTYILKEDEVLAGDGQSCIEMDELSIETIQLRPSTSSADQSVTLVQLSGDVVVGSAGKGRALTTTTSGLPSYDESQQGKEHRQVIAIVKDGLGQEKIIIDQLEDTDEEIQGVPMIIDQTAGEEPQTFTLVHDDAEEGVVVPNATDTDDDDDDDDGEDEILQIEDDSDDDRQRTKAGATVDAKEFPKKFIHEGQLVVRGKELSTLMGRFYDLTCESCMESGKDDDEIVSFTEMDLYLAHCKEMHGTKGHVWCCSGRILKPKMMAMHMARHLQPDAFRCPECSKLLSTPQILQYHIQNHRPEDERPLQCRQCPRRFSYGSALLAHSQSHLPEDQRTRHVCDECGKSFSTAKKLTEHVAFHDGGTGGEDDQRKSNQLMTYVCQVCAKQFTSKSNLTYHLTTHQPKIHQVQCELCKKWLRNKLCLRKHMVQHSETRHKCTQAGCDYSALNLQCLRNHLRVQHSDAKPFECDVCGKTFKLKNTLLNHQVQHTGVKKFACEFCQRTFASSGNYYAHRKRMHPQELAVQKKRKEDEDNEFRKTKLLAKSK